MRASVFPARPLRCFNPHPLRSERVTPPNNTSSSGAAKFQSTPAPIGAGDASVPAIVAMEWLFQSTPAPIGAGDADTVEPVRKITMFQSTPAPIGAGDAVLCDAGKGDYMFQSTPAPIGAGDPQWL